MLANTPDQHRRAMAPPYRYLAQVTAIVDRLVIEGSGPQNDRLG